MHFVSLDSAACSSGWRSKHLCSQKPFRLSREFGCPRFFFLVFLWLSCLIRLGGLSKEKSDFEDQYTKVQSSSQLFRDMMRAALHAAQSPIPGELKHRFPICCGNVQPSKLERVLSPGKQLPPELSFPSYTSDDSMLFAIPAWCLCSNRRPLLQGRPWELVDEDKRHLTRPRVAFCLPSRRSFHD